MAGEMGTRQGSPSVGPPPSLGPCGHGAGGRAKAGLTLSPPGLEGLLQGGRVGWEQGPARSHPRVMCGPVWGSRWCM